MVDARASFGELRGLLHQEPSTDLWRTLARFVDRFPPEIFEDEMLEYMRVHLASWPDALRVAPRRWVDALVQGERVPQIGIARHLRYSGSVRLAQGQEDFGEFPAYVTPGTHFFTLVQQLEGKEVSTLIQSPWIEELGSLELVGHRLGDAVTARLARAKHLVNLRELVLSSNHLSSRSVKALARAPALAMLHHLNLARNRIDDAGFVALVTHMPLLKTLDVLQNVVGAQGAITLARDGVCHELEVLNLRRNPIGPDGFAALCKSDRFSRLHTLDVRGCDLTEASARLLATSSSFPSLKSVRVSVSEVGVEGINMLLASTRLSREAIEGLLG